jgi:hypothetical protein
MRSGNCFVNDKTVIPAVVMMPLLKSQYATYYPIQ